MANLQELKKLMGEVPDRKIYNNKPMKGPIHEKKSAMANKMKKPNPNRLF